MYYKQTFEQVLCTMHVKLGKLFTKIFTAVLTMTI